MRAQDGKRATCDGIVQMDVFRGTHCHTLAFGAKGDRADALLPFRQDDDLLAGGSVPQPARAGPREMYKSRMPDFNPVEEAIRLPSELKATRG